MSNLWFVISSAKPLKTELESEVLKKASMLLGTVCKEVRAEK